MTQDHGSNVLGLDHVSITTPGDLEAEMLEWYEACLGLERIEKAKGTREAGGWFRAGNQQVHVQVDQHNPPQVAHFGLAVTDLAPVIERLRAANCHLEQARPIRGRKRFYTRDPAGNRIEILTYDESASEIATEGAHRATVMAEE